MEFPDDPEEGEVYDPYKPLDMEDVTGGLPESAEHIWNRPLALGKQTVQALYRNAFPNLEEAAVPSLTAANPDSMHGALETAGS